MNDSVSIPLGNVSVTIGMPVDNGIPPRTVMSLAKTVYRCAKMGIRCDIAMEVSGVIQIGRDAVLDDFVRSNTDKLFWIDSDMVWEPEDFLRLLALSTKVDCVCAAYPAKVEGDTQYFLQFEPGALTSEYGLVPINGIGLGFSVVSRKVCEALTAKAPRVHDQITGREVAAVFRVDIVDGHRRTEDMAFFADIKALGHGVYLDPHVNLGHIGDKVYQGVVLDAFKPVAKAA